MAIQLRQALIGHETKNKTNRYIIPSEDHNEARFKFSAQNSKKRKNGLRKCLTKYTIGVGQSSLYQKHLRFDTIFILKAGWVFRAVSCQFRATKIAVIVVDVTQRPWRGLKPPRQQQAVAADAAAAASAAAAAASRTVNRGPFGEDDFVRGTIRHTASSTYQSITAVHKLNCTGTSVLTNKVQTEATIQSSISHVTYDV